MDEEGMGGDGYIWVRVPVQESWRGIISVKEEPDRQSFHADTVHVTEEAGIAGVDIDLIKQEEIFGYDDENAMDVGMDKIRPDVVDYGDTFSPYV